MNKELFNQDALSRISSPEQLDRTIRIIKTGNWMAVTGLALVFCAVFIWAFIGSIPEKVGGNGVILAEGRVMSVNAPAAGIVKDVFVKNGSSVKNGQIIARIQRNDLLDQIQESFQKLDILQEQYSTMLAYATGNLSLNDAKMRTSKSSLEVQRVHAMQDKMKFDEIAEKMQALFNDGLVTEAQLLSAQNDAYNEKQKLMDIELAIAGISVDKFQLSGEMEQRLQDLEQNVEDICQDIELLQTNYRMQTKVISDVDGKVFEISASRGDYVSTGTSIAKIEPSRSAVKKYQAVIYFDASEGKKIKRGMNIAISPTIVKQEEYGYIQGIVTDVSVFPVTSEYIINTLHHDGLTSRFSGNLLPIEVKADLIPDPNTYSKYKWSSSRGPAVNIESGLICSGEVTVRDQRPISLVIPTVKKVLLGIGDTVTVSGE